MPGRVRFGLSVSLVAVASLAASAPAPAAVSCNFAAATATITADAAGNTAIVYRNPSPAEEIRVNGSAQCGSATVTNTDSITFTDSSGSNTKMAVSLGAGQLVPGLTDETGGSDEIEMTASFGTGGFDFDVLEVSGCDGATCAPADDHVVWGSSGINLNADEAPVVDTDVTATGAESYQALGLAGNDTLAADGGFGTGIASPVPVLLTGFAGMDFLTGGTEVDGLDGGADNDELLGGTGNDNIAPGPGDDQLNGEGGTADIVNFGAAANGVSVDLTQNGAQDTGEGSDLILGVESVIGSSFDDPLLSGSDVANNIQGSDGNDTIRGLDGDDSLSGGIGDDVIDGGPDDVVGDVIAGGDGVDTADYATAVDPLKVDLAKAGVAQQTVGAGTDTLSEIENLAGGSNQDRIRGNGGANVLSGRGGGDKVKGRHGKDLIKGGGGGDVALARDGDKDTVRCGGGHDVAKADAKDKLKGCEQKQIA